MDSSPTTLWLTDKKQLGVDHGERGSNRRIASLLMAPGTADTVNTRALTLWGALPMLAAVWLLAACTGTGASSPATNNSQSSPPAPTPPPSVPTVSLTANPSIISSGSASTLSWSATNVSSCVASGAWSGPKSTSGSQGTGSLTTSAIYVLTCTGSGGSANRSVTVTVSGGSSGASLSGTVDSSRVDSLGVNAVYVYAGIVTPDDIGSSGANPVITAAVLQDNGACTWRYAVTTLTPGQYTVAFTNQASNDNPQQDDAITFVGTAAVTVTAGGTVHNFTPARLRQVGPGKTYATVRAAAAVTQDNDVIEIDAGEYPDDIVIWRQNNITLRGVGGRAHMRATRLIPYTPGNDLENGMGIWVTRGNNINVENIEFSGARVPDQNGAGIRIDGQNLKVCNGYFHDNENGVLGGGGDMLIEYSEFAFNGTCEGSGGCAHNMYISNANRFTLRHSYSHHARVGHNVKTRARENYILYNRIMDEADGTASYAVDIPDGGNSYLIGNLIQQGPMSQNSSIVAYAAESAANGTLGLYVVNNTIVNDFGSGRFLDIRAGTTARIVNNLFVGNGTAISGPGTSITNIQTNSPGLVNLNAYDYHPTSSTPGRNAGSNPGTANGFDLTPGYHYLHSANREARPTDATIDIGAYEYTP